MFSLRCIACGESYPAQEQILTCRKCRGLLEVVLELDRIKVSRAQLRKRKLGVWRYREFLPVSENAGIVTLQEGGTPLYKAENLARELGMKELYIKNEGANPTGSFKDRGMTLGVTKALEFGVRAVGCASTGNTSASLAAYAAKAKLRCVVLLPAGKIAQGKLSQAILHGATVIAIKDNFDSALKLIREASARLNIYLLNSLNPWRLEGQKTEAFEIADQLEWSAPERVILPMGNCGNISAIWKGFKEFRDCGLIDSIPKMVGIQAAGASPVVDAFKQGAKEVKKLDKPETLATAIRIGAPVNAPKALAALHESRGTAESVSDKEILAAQRLLARTEGIGVEPASAASIAGLLRLLNAGEIQSDERVVCITTGHALKDPDTIIKEYERVIEIEPRMEELERVLSLRQHQPVNR